MTDGRTDGRAIAYTRYSIYAVARKNHTASSFLSELYISLTLTFSQECFSKTFINIYYTKFNRFYRAMHFSAKRGIAIACLLPVRLSVCDVGEL